MKCFGRMTGYPEVIVWIPISGSTTRKFLRGFLGKPIYIVSPESSS